MGGGNQEGGCEAQAVKVCCCDIRVLTIGLVHDQVGLLARTAHMISNEFIARCQPGTAIHQEQNNVGFFHGLHGLPCHLKIQPLFVSGETTSINNNEALALVAALAVFAISGEAGEVGNQGIPGTGHLVEQSRFANVRTSDKGNYWGHNR